LAAVETAAYAEDLVRAYKVVRAVYSNGIMVMHGIPFLLSGIQEHIIIRSLLEIGTWYSGVSSHSTKELSGSLALLTSKLKAPELTTPASASSTPDVSRAPERYLLKMPQNL
jgi:hypothetical protein